MDGSTPKELVMFFESIYAMMQEKSSMSETAFNLWFKDFHLISISDEKVVLATPDNIKRKVIVERYFSLVEESVFDALDYKPRVEIICDGIKEFSDSIPNPKVNLSKGRYGRNGDP